MPKHLGDGRRGFSASRPTTNINKINKNRVKIFTQDVHLDVQRPSERIFKPGRHKELTLWDEIKFFYEIVHRTFIKGPKIRKFVRENSNKVKTFQNYKEVNKYLESL